MEATKTLVNVNGVLVPGISRDGAFLSETPIETFVLFRSGSFSASQSKNFLVDFPCKLRSVIIGDTNSDTTYTFTVLTAEGVSWTMIFAANNIVQVVSYGNVKLINFPIMVLDRGTKVTVAVSKAVQSIAVFTNLSFNIDVKDF